MMEQLSNKLQYQWQEHQLSCLECQPHMLKHPNNFHACKEFWRLYAEYLKAVDTENSVQHESKEMLIIHRIIPHKEQEYATAGMWERPSADKLFITASRFKEPLYQDLVLLHEQIEAQICYRQGVKEEDVTAFDIAYEESRRLGERAPCGCKHMDEPGDDIHAPYRVAHSAASKCERIIALALGVDWLKYNEAVNAL